MTPEQMRKTLETAMQDRVPTAYRQLKALNQLEPYLDQLTGRTLDSIGEAKIQALAASATQGGPEYQPDAQKRIQKLNSMYLEIENQAIAQAVDEIEGLATTEFNPES